jgi:hypothetical protein
MSYWKFGNKYAGVTSRGKRFVVNTRSAAMSKAGKKSSSKRATKTKKTKRRKTMARTKKKKGGSRGSRILGNMGLKGLLLSGAILFGMKYVVRRFVPQAGAYTTGLAAFGAGTVGKATGIGGKSLQSFGAVDAISELVYDLVTPNGMVSLPSVGSGGSPMSAKYNY